MPQTFQLVIATRSDPMLPLARLRARGELLELRAEELRFQVGEAADLLGGVLGLDLTDAQVQLLCRRTEGWAAGLHLAGLSLAGRTDAAAFINTFAGDNRHIVDYLMAEVLDGQPPELRDFLLRTSVLGRLCGELCDAVLQTSGSAAVLEKIERENLFVMPLDMSRHWYRYHQLFGELLRTELRRSEPDVVADLYRRAATWFETEGLIDEAERHLVAGGDIARSADLIAADWFDEFNGGGLSGERSAGVMVTSRNQGCAAGEELTPKELEVLRLLPTRLTRSEIAARLYVSLNTVKTHQRAVYRKLRVEHRSTAVSRARELGLL
jgi:LuxR family maltose regulon positive regulatory protein